MECDCQWGEVCLNFSEFISRLAFTGIPRYVHITIADTATQPWINSSNQEAYVWKTALQMSGNKVITQLPILDNVKPTYL